MASTFARAACVAALAAAACRPTASKGRPLAWDVSDLHAPLATTEGPPSVVEGVDLRTIELASRVWSNTGVARAIRLRGFVAAPLAEGRRHAGVVLAHGLGSEADPRAARDIARHLDAVAIAVSAPGLGGSEGRGPTLADASPIFEATPDPRGSWLYAYVHALLRAVTLLRARPDVDPERIVISGTSMGGVAALVASGVDPRIYGVLAVNASGNLRRTAEEGSWIAQLVASARGRTLDGPDVRTFDETLDPRHYVGHARGLVYLLAGAQDEFFPLDAVIDTFAAVAAPDKRLALVPDFDHQWYFAGGCPAACMPGGPHVNRGVCAGFTCPLSCPEGRRWPYCGPESAYDHEAAFLGRWSGLLGALTAGRRPPAAPVVTRAGDAIEVRTSSPGTVRVAVSDNGGFTYGQRRLLPDADGVHRLEMPGLPADAIVFAEIEDEHGAVATSVPQLPRGFRPIIRPFAPR